MLLVVRREGDLMFLISSLKETVGLCLSLDHYNFIIMQCGYSIDQRLDNIERGRS